MELVVAGELGRSFRKGANEEAHRRALQQLHEQKDRDRRQKEELLDQSESDFIDFATSVITEEQADLFQSELNVYHEASYAALCENEELLEEARDRLQATLSRAHVLDDGRRVFKTEDGLRVFDEHGNEIDNDTISPGEIPDEKPRWEQFQQDKGRVLELIEERENILEFQEQLDEAQEMLDSGEMTQEQFDERRQYLRDHAPDAVKAHAKGIELSDGDKPAATASSELDIDLDDELVALPTPQPVVPGMGG